MVTVKKILLITLCFLYGNSFASSEQERIYLVQLINQLDAMIPTILAAERKQPKNLRVQFHYTAWQDNKGQWHNGLLEDVKTIRTGIYEKLHSVTPEPRVISSINKDYLPMPIKK